jgi:hypothetical protein
MVGIGGATVGIGVLELRCIEPRTGLGEVSSNTLIVGIEAAAERKGFWDVLDCITLGSGLVGGSS